jgi:biotin carboxyl carrier protein
VTRLTLVHDGEEHAVEIVDAATIRVNGRDYPVRREPDGSVRVGDRRAWVARDRDTRWVFLDGRTYELSEAQSGARPTERRHAGHHGALTSPMPATVRRVAVAVGDRVKAGETLLVLEAMKMELPVRATQAGTVKTIACREGELVQPGVPLVELE